jgi:hypothetical protein
VTVSDRVLARIEALWAKGHRTDNPHERDAFIDGARRLMEEHGVDEETLRERVETEPPTSEAWVFSATPSRRRGKEAIFVMVAEVVGSGTRVGFLPPTEEGPQWCVLVGYPTEVAVAKLLYQNLLGQALHEAWAAGAQGDAMVDEFFVGFAWGAAMKVREARAARDRAERETNPAVPGVGLVLADRAKRVDEAVAALGMGDDEEPIDQPGHGPAALAGLAAGRLVDVNIQQRLDRGDQ